MKIALVILLAFSLSGCFGAGAAAAFLGGFSNGSSGQRTYYVQQQQPPSYACYSGAGTVSCYPN